MGGHVPDVAIVRRVFHPARKLVRFSLPTRGTGNVGKLDINRLYSKFYAIIGNCIFGNVQVGHSPTGLRQDCWLYADPSPRIRALFTPFYGGGGGGGRQRIIYNTPPSRPHLFACYNMQGEGCLLLPRSSMGTPLHRPQSRSSV